VNQWLAKDAQSNNGGKKSVKTGNYLLQRGKPLVLSRPRLPRVGGKFVCNYSYDADDQPTGTEGT
jgi:hypothetical protein